MNRRPKGVDLYRPKPVHPRAVRYHGLFGYRYVHQHLIGDDRWTQNSLMDEFKGMAGLLEKRFMYKKLRSKRSRQLVLRTNRDLKAQCYNGRLKLQNVLHGDNKKKIHNCLMDHKDMQRLYQKLPVYQVVDNINQRTFSMRKERDRLTFQLDKLKVKYGDLLVQRGQIQDRIKYENEFMLEEEAKSREFMKRIENSNVRLKAIMTINSTYKKMVQVLRHDSTFYEPILRSLDDDIEDQSNFIKHILYLGQPAIAKFKELSEEYRKMEDKIRKSSSSRSQWMAECKRQHAARIADKPKAVSTEKLKRRYLRETVSMEYLKDYVGRIEDTIKQVKFVTLCSQVKEIYPRIRHQMENNKKLIKDIGNDVMRHQMLESQQKRADVLQDVLVHNLTKEELRRLELIKLLKEAIADEDKMEAATLAHMKNRADVYVLLRFSLWNLYDILRHVGKAPTATAIRYPRSYLKMPLLKFEMLHMRAFAPDPSEENLHVILQTIKRKLHVLTHSFKRQKPLTPAHIAKVNHLYHDEFIQIMQTDSMRENKLVQDEVNDVLKKVKSIHDVPSRKRIKMQSAKLVEELSKKEE